MTDPFVACPLVIVLSSNAIIYQETLPQGYIQFLRYQLQLILEIQKICIFNGRTAGYYAL